MLFNASQAIPPVKEPSPTTQTTVRSDCLVSIKPFAMPSLQESAVDACEFSTTSCSLSTLFGYPARPPRCLNLSKPAILPVNNL